MQFLLYSSNLSKIGVIFNSFAICVFAYQSVQVYPAVLMYLISVAVILLASLALTVQISLPYNRTGRDSVLYNFILVFLRVSFILTSWYTVLTNEEMTTESQRYNCFTRKGGNAIPKHAGPEPKGSNPTTGLTMLRARNPFRGNFNHWQFSRKETEQTFCVMT